MANIAKRYTNLPVIIWVHSDEPMQHNMPRIKFQNTKSDKIQSNMLVPLSIEDDPQILIKGVKLNISGKELQKIKDWVVKNKMLLLKYWNSEITAADFIFNMQKV